MDKSHASYRRLRMGRRDIVETYITHLVGLYQEHQLWSRAEKLASRMIAASTDSIKDKYFEKKRYGMIRNLLVPDYRIQDILSIIRVIAFTIMIQLLLADEGNYCQPILIASGACGIFTVWEQITTHNG